MKSNKPDISLIRKYLNGELDAKAMYKLERQAQDDPMLMDVIMGMEGDHQDSDDATLAEIGDLIRKRVQESKTVKIFAWKPWAAAASLIFAFMAAFWMFRSPRSLSVQQQMQVKQAAPAEKQPELPIENKVPAPVILPKIPLAPIQIAKSSAKTMKPELAKISAKTAAAPAPFDQVPAKVVLDSAAIARVALLKQYAMRDSIIAIQLRAKESNNAVASVTTAMGVQRKVVLRGKSTINDTLANVSNQQLSEVVTVGYGIRRSDSNKSLQEVVVTKNNIQVPGKTQPGIGWKEYKKYLKKNAVLSDSTKGTVVIAFIIGGNGLPANLKIIKSLSGEADNKAINLIYSGPRWIAGKDDRTKEIKVKIKFH